MIYSELEAYISGEVIKDRAFLQNSHLLNTINLALPRFAADYASIDPDFYHEEWRGAMTFGTEVNLGKSLGLSGALVKSSYSNDISLSLLGQGNKSVNYGIKDKYNEDDDLVVELVDNSDHGLNMDTSDVVLMWTREPLALTGVGTQYVDMPSRYKYEFGLLVKHFYYENREFYDEANNAYAKYRAEMNLLLARKRSAIYKSEIGRTSLPKTYYNYR